MRMNSGSQNHTVGETLLVWTLEKLLDFLLQCVIHGISVIPQLRAAKECHCDPAFRGTGGLAMTNPRPAQLRDFVSPGNKSS
jgi:hypothetical protein